MKINNKNYKLHPWHGISAGEKVPEEVNVFVEIVPTDTVKYEIDKRSGFLMIDRPQKYSNIVPTLYGFIPHTYSNERVAQIAKNSGAQIENGDHDPVDICVLTSHNITHGDILLKAIPIGGLTLIDKGEADDKIIAVLVGDQLYGQYRDISELPKAITARIEHYFLTYKNLPDQPQTCQIHAEYGAEHAKKVILASMDDYQDYANVLKKELAEE